MGLLALRVEGMGKRYRLRGGGPSYDTFADALRRTVGAPVRWLRGQARADTTATFWALDDVSFEIPAGQAVGVIGRNGAGKSTLLKILSGVTEPTVGQAVVWGTMGALLEVGTGFHPELTGRENVFLNGAILGMRRAEVARKFDEIVAFSGIEKFIDTPAKHYSSGMYMRLAFAVAAHLETSILLVDEVLAVGDAEFQRKCLQKMEQVGSQGRTVLFVSHDMAAVTRLCSRAILLDQGRVVRDGMASEVVHHYLHGGAIHGAAVREWPTPETAPGDQVAKIRAVRVLDEQGKPAPEVDIRRPVRIEVDFWNLQPNLRPSVTLHLFDDQGTCIFATNDFVSEEWKAGPRDRGLLRSTCHVPGNFFAEGLVRVLAAVSSYGHVTVHALERDAVAFTIVDRSIGDGVRGPYTGEWPGVVRPMLQWKMETLEAPSNRPAG
jgi:lipopolysaccharide transport system ATP-binding protein